MTRTVSLRSRAPEEEINDSRAGSRTRFGSGLRFTYGVPLYAVDLDLQQAKNPATDWHFRALRAAHNPTT
jgi:hypothetical protein